MRIVWLHKNILAKKMNKETINKMKNEALWILILLVLSVIAFKIVFYKESLLIVIRVVMSIFWLFVLPGFIVMYYWHEKLEFAERLIIGVPLSTVLVAIPSYYLGLLGLNIKYQGIILPFIVIVVGLMIIKKRKFNPE